MRRSLGLSFAIWLSPLALAHHGGAEYDLRTLTSEPLPSAIGTP